MTDEHNSPSREEFDSAASGVIGKEIKQEFVENSLESKHNEWADITSSDSSNKSSNPCVKENPTCRSGDAEINPSNSTFSFSPSWSESLNSPTDNLDFSPSESDSRHGLGT